MLTGRGSSRKTARLHRSEISTMRVVSAVLSPIEARMFNEYTSMLAIVAPWTVTTPLVVIVTKVGGGAVNSNDKGV